MERFEVVSGCYKCYLTKHQLAFKARFVKITKPVKVHGLICEVIPKGTVLETSPLYPDFPGLAVNEDGTEVCVKIGRNSTCWIPANHWIPSKSRRYNKICK
jgi:hypothetical protein